MARPVLAALLLSTALLAGCSGGGGSDPTSTPTATGGPFALDGRDLRTELGQNDTLEALLPWSAGMTFDFVSTIGVPAQLEGLDEGPFTAIVAADEGIGWLMGTDQAWAARLASTFGLLGLGRYAKEDLQSAGVLSGFDLYDFPMVDGANWTKEGGYFDIDAPEFVPDRLSTTVTYNRAIDTPLGNRPGFDMRTVTSNGTLLYTYDYVPAVGWFTHFEWYYLGTPDVEDDLVSSVVLNDVGTGFKGSALVDSAEEKVFMVAGFAPNTVDPTASIVSPVPPIPFDMGEGSTSLFGILVSATLGGVNRVTLLDPQNQATTCDAVGGAPDAAFSFCWETLETVPGTWTLTSNGAGVAFIGLAWLFEVTEGTIEVGASSPSSGATVSETATPAS
ncbi:MAG TPA: hypothetical protein VI796_05030 [Candidatus Thermoplasmatota archaeon]|nr:hypothetical protein [Candidatus Thermoplasmatota archaeon]